MAAFLEGRKNKEAYSVFYEVFVPCITKKNVYEHRLQEHPGIVCSKHLCTPSDEALGLVMLENSYDRWMDIYRASRHNLKSDYKTYREGKRQSKVWLSDVAPRYTRGGVVLGKKARDNLEKRDKENARKNNENEIVYKGWTDEGVRRYNTLYDFVEEDIRRFPHFVPDFVNEVRAVQVDRGEKRKRKKLESSVCGRTGLSQPDPFAYDVDDTSVGNKRSKGHGPARDWENEEGDADSNSSSCSYESVRERAEI
jgi:hypothetical protein